MKSTCVFALLLGCGLAFADREGITVIGKAELKQAPDVAYVTLYVEADGMLVTDAVKRAESKVTEVKTAIEEQFKELQGFEVREVSVGDAAEMGWDPGASSVPKPKVVRKIRITMKPDTSTVYELLDTAIRAGALLRSGSSSSFGDHNTAVVYGVLDTPELKARLQEAAFNDARQAAERLATLTGQKLGKISNAGCGDEAQHVMLGMMDFEDDLPTPYVGSDSKEIVIHSGMSVGFSVAEE